MTIYLHPEMTILEMNETFQASFPYLKLEFFTRHHRAFEGSPVEYMVKDHQTRLDALNPGLDTGDLLLSEAQKVRELEALVENRFGLFVQVFRKSHDVWLATSTTDNLSLSEQNGRGERAEHPAETPSEPIDYREQD